MSEISNVSKVPKCIEDRNGTFSELENFNRKIFRKPEKWSKKIGKRQRERKKERVRKKEEER